jgi:hypothetical protein
MRIFRLSQCYRTTLQTGNVRVEDDKNPVFVFGVVQVQLEQDRH